MKFKSYIGSPEFNNLRWLTLERLIRLVLALSFQLYMASVYGVELFGQLSYVLMFTAYFCSLSLMGIDSVIVNRFVSRPEKVVFSISLYFGFIFLISLLLGLLCLFIILPQGLEFVLFIIPVFLSPFSVFRRYLESQSLNFIVARFDIFTYLIFFSFKFFVIYSEFPLYFLAFIYASESIFSGLIIYWAVSKSLGPFLVRFPSVRQISKLLRWFIPHMLPSFVSIVAIGAYLRIDQIMIEDILGPYELGRYSFAIKFYEPVYLLVSIIVTVYFPKLISELKSVKNEQSIYSNLLRYSLIISLGCSALIFVFVHFYARNSVLNEFYISNLFYVVMTINCVVVSLGTVAERWHSVNNTRIFLMYKVLIALVANIVMNNLLIPVYGLLGAIFSTLLANFFAVLVLDFVFVKTRRLFYLNFSAILRICR